MLRPNASAPEVRAELFRQGYRMMHPRRGYMGPAGGGAGIADRRTGLMIAGLKFDMSLQDVVQWLDKHEDGPGGAK